MERKASASCKRPYELGKRLEQMDRTRAAVLVAARRQLETGGVREFSMESLARAAQVTRQTIHNLFGTRTGVLEALFDQIAIDAGMERMRDVMTAGDPRAMLDGFIRIFSDFWAKNRLLLKRIHGIAAIDPELGKTVQARNQRRQGAATRVIQRLNAELEISGTKQMQSQIAALVALASFEFFEALVESAGGVELAQVQLPNLIRNALRIP